MKCPICEQGNLASQVDKNSVSYKGQTTDLDMHYSVCDFCGSEQSDAVQTRDNKREMLAFKKQVDGLLSGAEVRAARLQLGLSQAEAARLFGGGPVAFSKYESDDVMQSEAMDKLLRLVASMPRSGFLSWRQAAEGVVVPNWTTTQVAYPREECQIVRVVSYSAADSDGDWRGAEAA